MREWLSQLLKDQKTFEVRKYSRRMSAEELEPRLLLHAGSHELPVLGHGTEHSDAATSHHEEAGDNQSHSGHSHGGSVEVPAGEMAPTIILSATNDFVGGVHLRVELEHFQLSDESVDTPHQHGIGHLHLYVDEVKIGRFYSEQIHLTDLSPGTHTIRAEVSANDHRVYSVDGQPIEASTSIVVPENSDSAPLSFFTGIALTAATNVNDAAAVIPGQTSASLLGTSSATGDVNGDGRADLIVAAPGENSGRGTVYVVFGSAGASHDSVDLGSLNGMNGFTLSGVNPDENAGKSVATADINDDGYDDILIGAPFRNLGGGRPNAGVVYVAFGGGTFSANLPLNTLNGTNGVRLDGAARGQFVGTAVANAGDFNDDGIDDVVIGAPGADYQANNAGSAFVFFGNDAQTYPATIALDTLDGSNGFRFDGAVANADLGQSVSGAGDVNNDGITDIVIGEPNAGPQGPGGNGQIDGGAGAAHVLFGKTSNAAIVTTADIAGTNGFTVQGTNPGDQLGDAVSGGGDFNNDGIADVVVASPRADHDGYRVGAVYAVYGKSTGFPAGVSLTNPDGTSVSRLDGDYEADPLFNSLIVNSTGQTGYGGHIVNFTSVIPDDNSVFLTTTGVPHYSDGIGPWRNTSVPSGETWNIQLPRVPTEQTGAKTETRLGAVGVWIDGVAIFNWSDAQSWDNQGLWFRNAPVFEETGFDACGAHNTNGGAYHTHGPPICLMQDLNDDGSRHSPLLGWAWDGFPIYGPYGFSNPDGTGSIERMVSGWDVRNITERTTLPDGTPAPGPSLADVPLGGFNEDHEFTGAGHLDQYNGRFAVTPEYPDGIYHYHVTVDEFGTPAFPYVVGVDYYGVVEHNVQGTTLDNIGDASISVALTDDASGDNIDDLVIGDPDASLSGHVTGAVHLVHGSNTPDAEYHLHDSATDGVHYHGHAHGDHAGAHVHIAGLDGSGHAEIIAGAPGLDGATADVGGVYIIDAVAPTPPDADAGGPYFTQPNVAITVDGSDSHDTGTIVSYEWDLDNDGAYDDVTGATTTFTAAAEGGYVIGLRVTDDDAQVDTDTTTVSVVIVGPPVVEVGASDSDASEVGPDPGTFTFSRFGPATGDLTVLFTVTGPATEGTDYLALPRSIVIPDGQSSADLIVTPIDDSLFEGTERVQVNLVADAAYVIGASTIARTFIDDDETADLILGKPTDDSITINVIPYHTGELYFEYGTTPGVYSNQTSVLSATVDEVLETTISGLSDSTEYFYRMVHRPDGEAWRFGQEHSFNTQRIRGESFVFTLTADAHYALDADHRQAMDNILADNPDFNIDLGDTFPNAEATTTADVDGYYRTLRGDQYFGATGDSVPLFLVIGNHENEDGWHLYDTPFSAGVDSIHSRKLYYPTPVDDGPGGFYTGNTDPLDLIDEATYGDELREDYYAFEWGDVLYVTLNPFHYTPRNPLGSNNQWDWTLGRRQYDWLANVLATSTAKYKMVFSHHITGGMVGEPYGRGGAPGAPFFEWGGRNGDGSWGFSTERPGWGVTPERPEGTPIHQLFLDHGVGAFFHGHDHRYAYESIGGVTYLSMPMLSGNGFDGWYDEADAFTHAVVPGTGHLRVSVTPTEATVEYVRSDTNGVSHTFTIDPHVDDVTPPAVTIIQAATQSDPTPNSPISFDVVFSVPVYGFGPDDVALTGTAGASTVDIAETGIFDGTTYTITASGMTSAGTVIADIVAGAVTDGAGNQSEASTSTDNEVTFTVTNAPDLQATAFDAVTDHVLTGETDVTFTVQNSGPVAATAFEAHIVWSPNPVIGDADDLVINGTDVDFTGLAAGASQSRSVRVRLDKAVLYATARDADAPGQPAGTVSNDVQHLFLVIDVNNSVLETDKTNNSGQGKQIDGDDFTFFPWDHAIDGSGESNGTITPIEALRVISQIGPVPADTPEDFDGNRVVTPLEALDTLQRLAYTRNTDVFDDGGSGLISSLAAVQSASVLKVVPGDAEIHVPFPVLIEDEDKNGLFATDGDVDARRETKPIPDDETSVLDSEFAESADWLSLI